MKQVRYYVYPYKQGSKSAARLAEALNGKQIKLEGSRFKPSDRNKVVNWGSTSCPYSGCINDNTIHSSLSVASNKLQFFEVASNYPENQRPRFPDWTGDKSKAVGWLKKGDVVVRNVLNGHSGRGIEIVSKGATDLRDAPLYVKYIPKDAEYRVHVFNNEVIDVQRKVRDPDREPSNWRIRSHDNGFIYVRTNPDGTAYKDTAPEDVKSQALKAVACSGLVFGAVDIIWNQHRTQAFVLEINCAPGLEGETVQVYANAIRRYYA